jgi:hypothetical protein
MEGHRTVGRRELLAGVGAGVAAMAGCATTLNPLGQKVRYGDIDEPAAGEPVYRDWIPAALGPNSVPGSTSGLGYQVPGERGEETVGAPPMYYDEMVKENLVAVGVEFDSFEYVVRIGATTLGRASFDRDRVEQTILDRGRDGGIVSDGGYERASEYRGVDIYTRGGPEPGGTVAVGDELLAVADDPEQVEEILDTGAGTRARRHEVDDAYARLVDTLGGMPITDLHQVGGTEKLASGSGRLFDDSAAYIVSADVYADDVDISRADVEGDLADGSMGSLPLDANRVDLRIDEPVRTLVYKFDHDTYEDLPGTLFEYPFVTWEFDYDGAALTITHRAGTELDPSRYTLRDVRRGEPTDEQFDDRFETIAPGDTLTVDLGGRTEWHLRLEGELPGDNSHSEFDIGDDDVEPQDSTVTDDGPGDDGPGTDDGPGDDGPGTDDGTGDDGTGDDD